MPDVRYVCLSDLHLGSENSVLSALDGDGEVDGHLTAPALAGLVDCLGEIVSRNEDRSTRPTLVLGGDILEMALSAENRAAMVFERFADLAFPEGGGIFADTVYFVPGNHDHQLWESSREQQYAGYVRHAAAGGILHPPWPISRMLAFDDPNPVESALLNALVQRRPHRAGMAVRAVYPNMAIPSDDGRRWVVFHHGHFVESLYRVVSTVRDLLFPERSSPVDVWDIEAENGPWIDAMWTALGRSGEASAGLGGAGHDALKSDKAMRRLAAGLAAG
ncbi:MAG: metallophosphoesterase, partial [Actinomycetota bacterium]|nr:metallophosphoesterase [Actinomycetota bacterium]